MIFVPLTEKEADALLHALMWAEQPASVVTLDDLRRIEEKLRRALLSAGEASKSPRTMEAG